MIIVNDERSSLRSKRFLARFVYKAGTRAKKKRMTGEGEGEGREGTPSPSPFNLFFVSSLTFAQ